MSLAYKQFIEKNGGDPTVIPKGWCNASPRINEDGSPRYVTEQAHKDKCNINKIIRKLDRQGVISHLAKVEANPELQALVGLDYKTALDTIMKADTEFNRLPGEIRAKFGNDPARMLDFVADPRNVDELVDAGWLIRKELAPEPTPVKVVVVTPEPPQAT